MVETGQMEVYKENLQTLRCCQPPRLYWLGYTISLYGQETLLDFAL